MASGRGRHRGGRCRSRRAKRSVPRGRNRRQVEVEEERTPLLNHSACIEECSSIFCALLSRADDLGAEHFMLDIETWRRSLAAIPDALTIVRPRTGGEIVHTLRIAGSPASRRKRDGIFAWRMSGGPYSTSSFSTRRQHVCMKGLPSFSGCLEMPSTSMQLWESDSPPGAV